MDDGGEGGGSSIGALGSDFSQPPPQPPQAACHDPGAMVEGDAGPSLLDPGAFECPCGPCEYDCQKRAPVRSACACKRLLCRKCTGVAASLPGPAPCGLCGAEAVGPFEAGDFVDSSALEAGSRRIILPSCSTAALMECACLWCVCACAHGSFLGSLELPVCMLQPSVLQ